MENKEFVLPFHERKAQPLRYVILCGQLIDGNGGDVQQVTPC